MKSSNKIGLVISALSVIIFALGCEILDPVDPEPDDFRSYKFTVKRENSYLSNATVSIQTADKDYSGFTDSEGKCQIIIPNGAILPDFLIVTVDHNNVKPRGFSVSGSTNTNSNKVVTCSKAPSKVLVKEVTLHHLGNDQYSGSANSQHQLPTEGIEIPFSFYLSSIPGTMPYLQIFARGVQHSTKIIVNGQIVNTLGDSSPDGDLSFYDFDLNGNPANILKIGFNTLTIKTGENNESDPWDDIEFCALLLYYL